MRRVLQAFDPRQEMRRSDYEIVHKLDTTLKNVELHHHDFYEVNFLLSGSVTYAIESRVYRVLPGDLLVISPRELHQVFIEPDVEPYERYMLWITPPLLCQLSTEKTDLAQCFDTTQSGYSNLIRLQHSQRTTIRVLMDELCQAADSDGYGMDLLPHALLTSFMTFVNQIANQRPTEANEITYASPIVSEVITYINLHYAEPLSLDLLAEKFYVSKYHLSHEFSQYVGTSVYRYLQKKRLLMASQMLIHGKKPNEVSIACGFGDYTSFYRAFRAEYGTPPREYAYDQGRIPSQLL